MRNMTWLTLCCAGALLAGCQDATQPGRATDLTTRAGPSSQVNALQITVIDLGVTGYATGVNPRGEVTGYADLEPGNARAFLWKAGRLTYLDAPGDDSKALAINPAGAVAGQRGATPHAVVWQDGRVTDLGTLPGDAYSLAEGINAGGQVVGRSGNPDRGDHGFVWERGVMTDLGGLEGLPGTEPFGINPAGQIVGSAFGGDATRAFLWDDGVMVDLGTLPGHTHAVALAINPAGKVVGWSSTADRSPRAFLWERGVMRDLGTLGGSESVAFAINSAGQIVGYSTTESGNAHAFMWDRGVMTDLGVLPGGSGSAAYGISERGDVVGFGNTATSHHPVLWKVR